MKKIIALIVVVCMAAAVTACGGGETSENGHVADQYHQLLEGKDTTYYYEADVVEQFMDVEEEASESVMAEGRDGKDQYVIMEGSSQLEQRQIETEDITYVIFDPDKEYTAEPKAEEEEEDLELKYVTTSEMELEGKTYRYDEYQAEYEMEPIMEADGEGESQAEIYLYVKRYLVDDSGQLYAIVTYNELKGTDGSDNEMIYQKIDTITKFQEGSVPDGIFDIPKDYKEVNYDDEDYEDEMISEEE
ncbi:hypothetical protein LI177_07645 [bacterium 210820-DFI.6.37]|nr:hypothetical protein [bacterium 210820-DFI.6.37]